MSIQNGVPPGAASETSPLLPKQNGDRLPPDGLNDFPEDVAFGGGPEGNSEEAVAAQRRPSSVDRNKQSEGMPEVRKMLKYIVPALVIGVGPPFFPAP